MAYSAELEHNADRTLDWGIDVAATAHGACLWFETELSDGIGFSAGPRAPERPSVYGSAFFPWPKPVDLVPGDRVTFRLAADKLYLDYIFRWDTRVVAAAGELKAEFRQSTFAGDSFSPEGLARRAHTHTPGLNQDGRLNLLILEGMAAGRTLGDIARELAEKFPRRFASWQQAMGWAGHFSESYGNTTENCEA